MTQETLTNEYIVFDLNQFTEEQRKPDGVPANAVLGFVRASDEFYARDAAAALFQDRVVFVRPRSGAEQKFVDAAEKQGYLNTSEAHRH